MNLASYRAHSLALHELRHVVQRRVLRYFRTHGLLDEADGTERIGTPTALGTREAR